MRLLRSDPSLESLYLQITQRELDLQPDYQRGEVWNKERQERLIDTILREWYVPAVHVVADDDSGIEQVLDGQQRLQTITRFMSGNLRVNGMIEPYDPDIVALDRLFFHELPETIQRRIRRFSITVITLTDYKPAEPSELFFRLNQQYSLTPSEKRNALYGEARDQVRDLIEKLSGNMNLLDRGLIGFSNGRLAYDDVISRFCVAVQMGTIRQQISNAVIERFYRNESFSGHVISGAEQAGLNLGNALLEVGGVRLNKATLLSWLLFSYSLNKRGQGTNAAFVEYFEENRAAYKSGFNLGGRGPIYALVRVFDNRGSYRVLDASSVILRDIALHGAYALQLPHFVSKSSELERSIKGLNDEAAESQLLAIADRLEWGAHL